MYKRINAFNNGNATAVFVNPTSNLLNKGIFTNPNAGMPLMLYLGKTYDNIYPND